MISISVVLRHLMHSKVSRAWICRVMLWASIVSPTDILWSEVPRTGVLSERLFFVCMAFGDLFFLDIFMKVYFKEL